MTDSLLLGFPDYQPQGQNLAQALGIDYQQVEIHHFPDGESLVRLPTELPPHVIFCRSLDHPNDKLIELLLACAVARRYGARHLTLVAPYLCYMRQDTENRPGEAVSQRIIGQLLAQHVDALVTVDPHLHRIERLQQAVPLGERAVCLTAAKAMAEFLRQQFQHAVLLGPDSESEQWVAQVARLSGFQHQVASKLRHGDEQVSIELGQHDLRDQIVVLVDDVASTGHTLAQAARQARQAGARQVYAMVTHAVVNPNTSRTLQAGGIHTLWSSDSVSHPSNVIALAPLLAEGVRSLNGAQ